jgi:hypothetical protein
VALLHLLKLTVQIKPLTEEEKKAKLADMRQKLAEKRALQSKIDAKETRANDVSSSHDSLFPELTCRYSAVKRAKIRIRSRRI